MPGIHRQSIDVLIETIKSDFNNGIRSIMLFGVIDSQLKDDAATQASNLLLIFACCTNQADVWR